MKKKKINQCAPKKQILLSKKQLTLIVGGNNGAQILDIHDDGD